MVVFKVTQDTEAHSNSSMNGQTIQLSEIPSSPWVEPDSTVAHQNPSTWGIHGRPWQWHWCPVLPAIICCTASPATWLCWLYHFIFYVCVCATQYIWWSTGPVNGFHVNDLRLFSLLPAESNFDIIICFVFHTVSNVNVVKTDITYNKLWSALFSIVQIQINNIHCFFFLNIYCFFSYFFSSNNSIQTSIVVNSCVIHDLPDVKLYCWSTSSLFSAKSINTSLLPCVK